MAKLTIAAKLLSGLKGIGSVVKGAFGSLGSAFKGLKGITVLKWGSITAGVGGVFYGIYSGVKNVVQTVSDGGTSTVKEVVKTLTGIELSDSQAMMIFVAIIFVVIFVLVRWYVRRKSRR